MTSCFVMRARRRRPRHFIDPRGRRASVQPAPECIERRRIVSLHDALYAAVGAIAHPAAQAQRFSLLGRGPPEEHALYVPSNEEAV